MGAPDAADDPADWRDLRLALSLLPPELVIPLVVAEFGRMDELVTLGKPPASPGKLLLICFINSFMPGMFNNPPREFKLPN